MTQLNGTLGEHFIFVSKTRTPRAPPGGGNHHPRPVRALSTDPPGEPQRGPGSDPPLLRLPSLPTSDHSYLVSSPARGLPSALPSPPRRAGPAATIRDRGCGGIFPRRCKRSHLCCTRVSHLRCYGPAQDQPDTLAFSHDLTFLPSALMRCSAAAWAWVVKASRYGRPAGTCLPTGRGWSRPEAALSLI